MNKEEKKESTPPSPATPQRQPLRASATTLPTSVPPALPAGENILATIKRMCRVSWQSELGDLYVTNYNYIFRPYSSVRRCFHPLNFLILFFFRHVQRLEIFLQRASLIVYHLGRISKLFFFFFWSSILLILAAFPRFHHSGGFCTLTSLVHCYWPVTRLFPSKLYFLLTTD
jgi:hypothetical protein